MVGVLKLIPTIGLTRNGDQTRGFGIITVMKEAKKIVAVARIIVAHEEKTFLDVTSDTRRTERLSGQKSTSTESLHGR